MLENIYKQINEYLTVMPRANEYNLCRQKETKEVLSSVHGALKRIRPKHIMISILEENIENISKWDGVTSEPEDIEFKLLLEKVKRDLQQIKTMSSI
jgi:hypothetical protein